MVYGILFNRKVLITIITHLFYPELRPKLQFDFAAAREATGSHQIRPCRPVCCTLAAGQYDMGCLF